MKRRPLKITIFHCINALDEERIPSRNDDVDLHWVKMPCSSMTKDIFLMRSFESGADGVIVMVCPEDACRYGEGSIRARKRVEWVRKILNEIGLNGSRLFLYNAVASDERAIHRAIGEAGSILAELGPNPACGGR